MFKNKKLSKVQILSLVASLTIFVGGSFNNDVIGRPKHGKTKRTTNSKPITIPLSIADKNKKKELKEKLIQQGKKK